MANNYTGMGQITAVQYQNVAGRMQRFLNGGGGGNAGRPINYAPSPAPAPAPAPVPAFIPRQMPQPNYPNMNYAPGNYQLMPSPSANYQPMYPQMNYGAARGTPYGYQPQYNPMAYGNQGYNQMMYGVGYGMMPGVRAH